MILKVNVRWLCWTRGTREPSEQGGASYWRLANALYQHRRRDLVESLCKAMLSSSAEESSLRCVSAEVSTDRTASSEENKDIIPERCESGTSRLNIIFFQQYSHD